MKLTVEEREAIASIVGLDEWKHVETLLGFLVQWMEQDLLRSDSSNAHDLIIKKARAEGARRLIANLDIEISKLTKPLNKSN